MSLLRKRRAWRKKRFHVVAVSQWLAEQARRSSLFGDSDIDVILPGVDTSNFRPHDQLIARRILGLPPNRSLIGFAAINPLGSARKGWDYLREALKIVRRHARGDVSPPLLVRVGAVSREARRTQEALETIDLGTLSDDLSLALAFSACDVLAVPSVQEAFGRVAIESLACGTPVVAFRGTGVADAVDHGRTGYLAEFRSTADFARGIAMCIDGRGDYRAMRKMAREAALKNFSTNVQAANYVSLYERLLLDRRPTRRTPHAS